MLSLFGAEVTAIVFVVILNCTLPPDNMAYGTFLLADSLVFPIMSMYAMVCGLCAFPFAFWLLRNVRLGRSAVVIILSAVAAVVVAALDLRLAIPCAFVAAVAAMFWCRLKYSMPYDPASNNRDADGRRFAAPLIATALDGRAKCERSRVSAARCRVS